jgi:hypothetical protein
MSSELMSEPAPPGSDLDPEAVDQLGGWVWLASWMAVFIFILGAMPLMLMIVARNAGPYGAGLLMPVLFVGCAIVGIGLASALSIVDRLWHRTRPFARTIAALAAFTSAIVFLTPAVAELLGVARPPFDTWPDTVAGVSLLALTAVLAAERPERRPALAFAAAWLLLIGIAGYSAWTDMEVEVAWLGPNSIQDSPGQFAFTATRSGEFEVRFGAHSCSDGRIIANGHYTYRSDLGSKFGQAMAVELPPDVLPLKHGDLVRACVRDGFAAATRAGEVSMAPSFWQRD